MLLSPNTSDESLSNLLVNNPTQGLSDEDLELLKGVLKNLSLWLEGKQPADSMDPGTQMFKNNLSPLPRNPDAMQQFIAHFGSAPGSY